MHIPTCVKLKNLYLTPPIRAGSSAVEQLAFNQLAEGSIPSPRTIFRMIHFCPGSSVVEQLALNQLVVGSNPSLGTTR